MTRPVGMAVLALLVAALGACATPARLATPHRHARDRRRRGPARHRGVCGPPSAAASPTVPEGQFTNPVIERNFADPFVLEVDGTYYAYATGNLTFNIQVTTSTDLVNWERVREALPRLPLWQPTSKGLTWAPEVTADGWRVRDALHRPRRPGGPAVPGRWQSRTIRQGRSWTRARNRSSASTTSADPSIQSLPGRGRDPLPALEERWQLLRDPGPDVHLGAGRGRPDARGRDDGPRAGRRRSVGAEPDRGTDPPPPRRDLLPVLLGQRLREPELRRGLRDVREGDAARTSMPRRTRSCPRTSRSAPPACPRAPVTSRSSPTAPATCGSSITPGTAG